MTKPWGSPLSSFVIGHPSLRERLHRFRLRNLCPALLAGPALVAVPEVEHCFAEVLHDIGAIETNILHHCFAVRAVKDDVFFLTWRPPAFHHHAERIRRAHRRVRDVRWDKKSFSV